LPAAAHANRELGALDPADPGALDGRLGDFLGDHDTGRLRAVHLELPPVDRAIWTAIGSRLARNWDWLAHPATASVAPSAKSEPGDEMFSTYVLRPLPPR